METSEQFFDQPVLNSPYEIPRRHWELDSSGQPTHRIIDQRRRVSFITAVPDAKKREMGQGADPTESMTFDVEAERIGTDEQQYELAQTINSVRGAVDRWRALPDPVQWRVTPETARLLRHWRHHQFSSVRPFFARNV